MRQAGKHVLENEKKNKYMLFELKAKCPMIKILDRRRESNYGFVRMELDSPY
jgi:hypothetical protein